MYNSEVQELLARLIGASIGVLIVVLAICVFWIAARWCLLNKAGEEGWKVLIPFYGEYTEYKVAGATDVYWGWLAANVLSGVFIAVGAVFLGALCSLAVFVCNILFCLRYSKAFGQDGGFAVGLILLPIIFFPVMAFSSSIQYVGYGAAQRGPMGYNGGAPRTPPTLPLSERGRNVLPPTAPFSGELVVSVISGPAQGARFRVVQSGVLGRDPGSQLLLNDPYVARTQCRFEQRNGKFYVVDQGATNATSVNGYGKLPPHTPVELRTGDMLTVGKSTLSIEIR